jgi:hypothetical protein
MKVSYELVVHIGKEIEKPDFELVVPQGDENLSDIIDVAGRLTVAIQEIMERVQQKKAGLTRPIDIKVVMP